MEKDNKIESQLKSLEEIQRAEPNPFLFTRIEAKIAAGETTKGYVMASWTKLAFCFSIFLIAINMIVINVYPETEEQAVEVVEIDQPDTLFYATIIQPLNFYENESN